MLVQLYIAFTGLSFFVSLNAFRRNFPVHLKLFACYLGCNLLVEILATIILRPASHLISAVKVYNIFMVIEYGTYAFFFRSILQAAWLRRLIGYYLIFFPIFWATTTFFIFGFNHWNSYTSIIGSLFSVMMAVAFYRQLFIDSELIRLSASAEFWISTGIIVYYSINMPFLGMLNFITSNYRDLALSLLSVLEIFNLVMYSLFIYAFLCRTGTTKSSPR